jgi:hypothetical protein|tara:strand:+ start:3968 stop:4231 length:264 start_codon:yes stop_codon:yes gene_type:complete
MSDINKTYVFETVLISGSTSGVTINFGPPVFDISTSGNTSYVGYGVESACKIKLIVTISGGTYNVSWANGDEILSKIWGDRLNYTYF